MVEPKPEYALVVLPNGPARLRRCPFHLMASFEPSLPGPEATSHSGKHHLPQ